MQAKTRWITGTAVAGALLIGATLASGVSAQTAPIPGAPGALCPGFGMMRGFGPRGTAATAGTFGAGVAHEAIAKALGITSQELWDARAAGKSVEDLAKEKNVPLQTVEDAALGAHSEQLDTALKAGTLTQAQADAMKQRMRSRIETHLQTASGFGSFGPGMMGGRGMMGGIGFGPGRRGAP
jgi:hypothetical protein